MGTTTIATALFGKARRAVLGILFSRAEQRFFLRELIRAANTGQGAVQRELRRLTEAGIILRTTEGRQVYYQANRDCPVFAELKGMVTKTSGAAGILREALLSIASKAQAAFIYGSMARGEEKTGSDVDLMIIGTASFDEVLKAVRPAEELIGREVNPTVYSPAEFRAKAARKHHFIMTVLRERKMFLIGDENELERLATQ